MGPGTKLGHYGILSALGQGDMGEVWRARDTKLGRAVAIKTLPKEFARDAERQQINIVLNWFEELRERVPLP